MEKDKAEAEQEAREAAEAGDEAAAVEDRVDGGAAVWAAPLPGDPAATATVRSADIPNRTNKAFPACSGNALSAARQ